MNIQKHWFAPVLTAFCFCLVLGVLSTSAMAVSVGDEVTAVCPACDYTRVRVIEFWSYETCVSPAIYEVACLSCDNIFEVELGESDPDAHLFVVVSCTDPTCTSSGTSYVQCHLCGKEEVNTTPAFGHSWQETSRTTATCTVAGTIYEACSRCNETRTIPIPSLGGSHTWTPRSQTTPYVSGVLS